MKTVRGSIWKLSGPLDYVVIPTTIGWRKDGTAIMQTGLARQAATRYEDLELWYGDRCLRAGPSTGVLIHRPRAAASRNLILFPVKPVKEVTPQMSWDQPACLALIERSAKELEVMISQGAISANRWVFVPPVGCEQNGRLQEEAVLPVLEKHLGRFEHVRLVHPR